MAQPIPADYDWMRVAIELAHQCPPSPGAFSVGAVIVDQNGNEISRGYSRETDSHVHEESALAKLSNGDPRLKASCQGYELLGDAGVEVVEIPELADEAKAPNTHLSFGP